MNERTCVATTGIDRERLVILIALALTTLAVYFPVRGFGFVDYDDYDFILSNPHVQQGLTWKGMVWALSDSSSDWWHPLTWWSHMLDVTLYGTKPGFHHLTNLALHIASTLLLFIILVHMTGAVWKSGFVAALFALHPLHVESVAWVAERKDVLSTLFWMLTMWAYCRYAERPGGSRYTIIVLAMVLGLMAKPMLVTAPFALLLLDYWPLRRLDPTVGWRRARTTRLIWEKIPLFALAAVSSVVTYLGQHHLGGVVRIAELPISSRLANVLLSYSAYLVKTVWPAGLAVFYPYPREFPVSQLFSAAMILTAISALAFHKRHRYPYLIVGWLWYLGTLAPVSGLIQVGGRAMADRFTYVPLIGVFIMAVWGGSDLLQRLGLRREWRGALAGAMVAACAVTTFLQLRYWRNSVTLFEHALAVTDGNYVAHNNLGVALMRQGKIAEASSHFQEALAIWPEYPEANKSLADVLAGMGRTAEAISLYRRALEGRPNWPDAENNLGLALAQQGQLAQAIAHFTTALRLEPTSATAHVNLGLAYMKLKDLDSALAHFSRAIELNPADAQVHYWMGVVLKDQGHRTEAIERFIQAVRLQPGYPKAVAELDKLSH